jgi:hypothetical protein
VFPDGVALSPVLRLSHEVGVLTGLPVGFPIGDFRNGSWGEPLCTFDGLVIGESGGITTAAVIAADVSIRIDECFEGDEGCIASFSS